jgi:drug/metabolite transporter (DMT)-like permease
MKHPAYPIRLKRKERENMKALGTGIVIACIAGIISFAAKDLQLFFIMMSGVVLICFGISGLLTNAFLSGDRIRATFHSETKEHREARTNWAIQLFLLGLPNCAAAIVSAFILFI